MKRDMSSDRPFYFFELSVESEVVFGGEKFCSELYIDIREEWIFATNKIWTPISLCIFFESGWDTEVFFGCSVTDWTVYRHVFRKDWAPEDGIWVQTDPCIFFELSVESEVVLWGKILFWSAYRHMWGMGFTTNRIWPRIRPLFFRAKRGIRGRFGVKNSVLKCI